MIGKKVWHWIREHTAARPNLEEEVPEYFMGDGGIEARAFLHAPVGMIVINESNIILAINSVAAALFGYAPNELAGENISKIMAGEPDPMAGVGIPGPGIKGQPIGRMLQRLEPENQNFIAEGPELAGRGKDGSLFPMELLIAENLHPEYGLILIGVVRDLSNED